MVQTKFCFLAQITDVYLFSESLSKNVKFHKSILLRDTA